jgi:hypothetical protein
MKSLVKIGGCALALSGLVQAEDSLLSALKGGKPTVELRYRYEMVDDDAFVKKAQASTLRTAIGYKTGTFEGFSGYIELEDVTVIGSKEYSDGTRAVVADPEGTEINESYVEYKSDMLGAKVGRQTLILDNARMIGNVGWRMNDQTFDAATLTGSIGKFKLLYSYLYQQNTILFGQDKSKSNILNGSFETNFGKLSLYYYGLDNGTVAAVDTDTYGVRFIGKKELNKSTKFLYTLEYAKQSDAADNPLSYDENYLFGELGLDLSGLEIKVGYENMTSNSTGTAAFRTPFATAHAFNGWADQVIMNVKGVKDTYVSVAGKIFGAKAMAVYHDLAADVGADYGSEIDLLLAYKTSYGPLVGAKAAFFDADAANKDVNKVWLWTEYSF